MEFFHNIGLQVFTFGLAVSGVYMAFRILRFPDLTADGTFMLASISYATCLINGLDWITSLILCIVVGGITGLFTAFISIYFKVNRLISGLLTSMICYSLSIRINNYPYVGIKNDGLLVWLESLSLFDSITHSLFIYIFISSLGITFLYFIVRSKMGVLFRATGENYQLFRELKLNPNFILMLGLAISNSLIALSAALVTENLRYASSNLGKGIIMDFIACLILGEAIMNNLNKHSHRFNVIHCLTPLVGTAFFYCLMNLIVKLSISGSLPINFEATDNKMLAAIIIISSFGMYHSNQKKHETVPS